MCACALHTPSRAWGLCTLHGLSAQQSLSQRCWLDDACAPVDPGDGGHGFTCSSSSILDALHSASSLSKSMTLHIGFGNSKQARFTWEAVYRHAWIWKQQTNPFDTGSSLQTRTSSVKQHTLNCLQTIICIKVE